MCSTDIHGKKFAFVRFDSRANLEEILTLTKGLWIGNHKLLANVALYDREDRSVQEVSQTRKILAPTRKRETGLSYSKESRGVNRREEPGSCGKVETERVAHSLLENNVGAALFKPDQNTISWAKKCLVCATKENMEAG